MRWLTSWLLRTATSGQADFACRSVFETSILGYQCLDDLVVDRGCVCKFVSIVMLSADDRSSSSRFGNRGSDVQVKDPRYVCEVGAHTFRLTLQPARPCRCQCTGALLSSGNGHTRYLGDWLVYHTASLPQLLQPEPSLSWVDLHPCPYFLPRGCVVRNHASVMCGQSCVFTHANALVSAAPSVTGLGKASAPWFSCQGSSVPKWGLLP